MRHANASQITRTWGSAISRLARSASAIAAAGAVLASVATNGVGMANAQELITNGSFAGGLTGWTQASWTGGSLFGINANGPTSTAAASGDYAYAGGGAFNVLQQDIAVTTGSAYRLTFLAGSKSGDTSTAGVLSLRQEAVGNYNSASFHYSPSNAVFGSYTVDFIAGATTVGVWLRNDGGGYASYDNVSVTPIAGVANALNYSAASGFTEITSVLTGGGKVTSNAGTGGLTLWGANTYTGGTEITGGTLYVTGAGTLGAASGSLSVSGSGVLDLRNVQTRSGTIAMTGQDARILGGDVNNPGSIVNNGVFQFGGGQITVPVSGTGGFNVTGGGSITGSNSYTGPTTIAATTGWYGTNTLFVANANALGDASGDLTISGGIVSLNGNVVTRSGSLIISGGRVHTGTLSKSSGVYGIQDGQIEAVLAGAAGLTKSGSGTATLSGVNSYAGGTEVTGGTLVVTGTGTLGAASGSLSVSGSGVLDLRNAQARTGTITMTGQDARILGGDVNNPGSIVNNGVFQFGGGQITVPVSGTGGFNITGGGSITGSNSYTGPTTISATPGWYGTNTLFVDNSNGLGEALADLTISGGIVGLQANTITRSGNLIISGGLVRDGTFSKPSGAYDIQGGQVDAVLAGAAGLTKTGAGTAALFGSNSYSGTTTVSAGQLQIANGNALGNTAAGTVVANGARLLLSPTSGNITVGNEALTISGTGSTGWVLRSGTGANTWGGKITLAANSTIQAASGAGLTVDVASGDAVDLGSFTATFNGAGAHVVNDPISGSGGVTKDGSGILTLAGNSTYTGATTVSLGKLLVNGDNSSATGAVTVAAGATLGGSGVIGGATTVNGILSPGNSPGELSIASLVLGGSSTSLFEINGTTRGTSYDGVTILQSGGLTYGGVLSLAFTGTFGTNTTFDLFSFSGGATGNFSSVTASGPYGSLTFVNDGFGVWTSGPTSVAGQALTFTQSTGDLVIVPEPSTVAMVGCVAACGGLLLRRRRALAASRR